MLGVVVVVTAWLAAAAIWRPRLRRTEAPMTPRARFVRGDYPSVT